MRTASDFVPCLSREEDAADDEELFEELLFEELLEEELPSAVAILASVLLPAMPSAESPFAFWKLMTAASVLLPK